MDIANLGLSVPTYFRVIGPMTAGLIRVVTTLLTIMALFITGEKNKYATKFLNAPIVRIQIRARIRLHQKRRRSMCYLDLFSCAKAQVFCAPMNVRQFSQP
jgi:hypothetical protein